MTFYRSERFAVVSVLPAQKWWFSASRKSIAHRAGLYDDCSAFFRYTFVMSQETAELLKRALNLSVAERAELADSLIESLEAGEDTAVQAAWDAEILRRMKDLESGTVKPVSLEEARRRLSSAVE